MQVYSYDRSGNFLGTDTAFEDPMNPGSFLMPANSTEEEPPVFDPETQTCTFSEGTWFVNPIPAPAPDPAPSLQQVQNAKLQQMVADYQAAIQVDVEYLNTTFQADSESQGTLSKSLAGMGGTAPVGFYWVDSTNNRIPMTFAECQGLAAAMFDQGWAAFQRLQDKKGEIEGASLETIGAITWTS